MNAANKTDEWRSKYLESVSRLESEKQRFTDLENALKKVTGRLCIATLGLSPKLDTEVRRLQALIKRNPNKDELEQVMAPLTEAIHALDHQEVAPVEAVAAAATASAPADDTALRATLTALLTEIRRDPALIARADALAATAIDVVSFDQLPTTLASLTELVGLRIQRIERARREAESLLAQMVSQLDAITHFVADQSQNQKQALASSESLNAKLAGEMKAMDESVTAASDLQQMRAQVRGRLSSIGQHLQDFRQREAERARVMQEKNEQMQVRVSQLEAEAQKLQSQLQAEQQASMIDTLTRVPNRLAYDKRIAEELQRWQRFQQATCIAAWDIDHFKHINDSYGHRAGDRVLEVVAESMHKRVRSTDFLARYGGEEFVMLFAGITLEQACTLADEIRTAIAKLGFHFRGKPVSVTASCGITTLQAGDTAESAFERADKALYRAKHEGRNRCITG